MVSILPPRCGDGSPHLLWKDLGIIGILSSAACLFVIAAFCGLLIWWGPTKKEIDREIWAWWLIAYSQGGEQERTLQDLLNANEVGKADVILFAAGQKNNNNISNNNTLNTDIINAQIKSLRLRQRGQDWRKYSYEMDDKIRANWTDWWQVTIVEFQDSSGKPWQLEVAYHFYQPIETLPISRIIEERVAWKQLALVIIGLLALVLLALTVFTARHGRRTRLTQYWLYTLRRQQAHEMGNAMETFSKNTLIVTQLLTAADRLALEFATVHAAAARRAGLEENTAAQLLRMLGEDLNNKGIGLQELHELAQDTRGFTDRFELVFGFFRGTVLEIQALLRDKNFQEPLSAFTLDEVWAEVKQMHEMQLRQNGIRLQGDSSDAVKVTGYRRRMLHALFNLCKNAMESARLANGERAITFRTWRDRNAVACTIENTGPPIPESIRRKLFAEAISSKEEAGRGQGLMVVDDYVRQNGGSVSLERSDERGTVFKIIIPIKASSL